MGLLGGKVFIESVFSFVAMNNRKAIQGLGKIIKELRKVFYH